MSRRFVWLVGLSTAIVAAILFSGCGSSSVQSRDSQGAVGAVASAGTNGGGEVSSATWVFTGAPSSLNIFKSWEYATFYALGNVLQGLQKYSAAGKLEPALAESAEQVNGVTYRYQLNPTAKFSNGQPVLASDVAYSLNYARDPKNGFFTGTYYEAADVRSVEAVGAHTVVVHLKKPNSLWEKFPAYPAMWVMPESEIVEHKEDLGTPDALPIGSGPYKIVSYVPGQSVTLEPNPYWTGPKPKIRKLTLSFVSDDATRFIAIKTGQADGTFRVPPDGVRNYEHLTNVNLARYQSAYYGNVEFIMTKSPFDDVHIRRMFAYATDRQGVIDGVLGGNARLAQALTPPEMWLNDGVDEKEALASYQTYQQYPFDLEKAKEELEKSKYAGTKLSFEMPFPSDSDTYIGDALQNTAQNLAKIGVDMKVTQMTGAQLYGSTYTNRATNGLVGFANIGFSDIPDGLENPYLNYDSKFAIPTAYNASYYKNKRMDDLLEGALRGSIPKQRADQAFEALKLSMKDLPQFTLWWEDTVTAVNKRLVANDLGAWTILGPWALTLSGAKEE
jgi:peptide/nickel transport system substrate-binding protein